MITIKVLGPGCQNCVQVETIARKAVANLSIQARIEKVTDYAEMKTHQILATPGLVINEQLVCAGRIPSEAEVISWLADAMDA